jgi:putative inorganic carbon (hco3(-)) transporter
LSDILSGAGLLIAAACAAASILLPAGRPRSAAMLTALVLFPLLILGDQWHNHQIVELRHHEAKAAVAIVVGAVVVIALAWVFRRWPVLMPLSIIATLPFRIPLESGGETANLLVPLYVVIAAGVLAAMFLPPPAEVRRPRWVAKTLAIFIVLYALQALYSEDYSKGLQEVCFFLVPFTLAYILLRELPWDRRLLVWALVLITVEAIAFVLIGSVEYASRSLFWNQAVIRSNEFHTYFRVNSIFWDPNIYGRYLALVLVVVTTVMMWVRQRRAFWLLCGAILLIFIGLAQTFSQSSFIALLAGLAVLAALRWSWRWTIGAVVLGIVGAAFIVLLAGGSHKLTSDRLNVDLSGRGNLVSGGAELFSARPLWGYGSGSFQKAYENHLETEKKAPVTISHTEPVTVGAEQGLIGLAAYLALVVVSLWTMGAGLWARGPDRDPPHVLIARAAILAAFVALLVHTMAYAGFFQDPITWVLMAVGASLAASHRRNSASSVGCVQSTRPSLRP